MNETRQKQKPHSLEADILTTVCTFEYVYARFYVGVNVCVYDKEMSNHIGNYGIKMAVLPHGFLFKFLLSYSRVSTSVLREKLYQSQKNTKSKKQKTNTGEETIKKAY